MKKVFIGSGIVIFILIFSSLSSNLFVYGQSEEVVTPSVTDTVETFTPTDTATQTETETPTITSTPTSSNTVTATPTPTLIPSRASNLGQITSYGDFVPDQVLVKFRQSISSESRDDAIASAPAFELTELPEINVTILYVKPGTAEQVAEELNGLPDVEYAEPNYLVHADGVIPNDPGFANQYYLQSIRAPQGWAWTTGAPWVTIAVLDTGIDYSHPDLASKILSGWDFVNNDSSAQDDNGHGTHVAGIAAAYTNNSTGIAGVNWGAGIEPVKVLNSSASGSYSNVAAGIIWATDHGAQVINMSFGGSFPSQTLEDAVNYAFYHGVILVAATGNTGSGQVMYPARYPVVLAVGASTQSNTWAGFSNYGPEVDVVAPGVQIYSTYLGAGYYTQNGTSMSAPQVSGLAAILRGIPGVGPDKARQLIRSTALDIGDPGWDALTGYGLIQMDAAIQRAWPTRTPTLIPTYIYVNNYFSATPPQTISAKLTTDQPTMTSTPLVTISPQKELQELTTSTVLVQYSPTIQPTKTLKPLPLKFWWLACGGSGLIIAGILFLWMILDLRRRKKYHHESAYKNVKRFLMIKH